MATLLEPVCLEAIALIETGLRGVRTTLTRLRGGITAAGAPDIAPPARDDDQVGRAPSARPRREPPRAVGGEQPARELSALLAGGNALSSAYRDDRVVLLARDPFCLFAYWDLAPSLWRAVESAAGSDRGRGVLRVSDVTQIPFTGAGAVRHHDLAIADPVGSSYVWIETPGRSYVAEVGYVDGDGTFVPLARSNLAWTPRAAQPGTDPIRWMPVRWTGRRERTHPTIGAAPTVRRAARSARAVSSFDAEAGAPTSDEHAGGRAPSPGVARRRPEPARTNGRD